MEEIGVREALGATPGGILRLVLLKGVALVGTGSAIGVAMAIFAVRTLSAFLMPNVHPTNPVTFLVVSSALCFVGTAGCCCPPAKLRLVQWRSQGSG